MAPQAMHNQAFLCMMAETQKICSAAESEIDSAINKNARLPITTLSKSLAEKLMLDYNFVYQTVSRYVGFRNDLEVNLGRYGGIGKKTQAS